MRRHRELPSRAFLQAKKRLCVCDTRKSSWVALSRNTTHQMLTVVSHRRQGQGSQDLSSRETLASSASLVDQFHQYEVEVRRPMQGVVFS